MRKLKCSLLVILLLFLFPQISLARQWTKKSTIGGTSADLDSLTCVGKADGDLGFVGEGGYFSVYLYNSSGTDSESAPDIVVPDDRVASCAGNGQWELSGSIFAGGNLRGTLSGIADINLDSIDNFKVSGTSLNDMDMNFTVAQTIASIELGNADTSLTRTGAGAIAVEGVGVALNSTSLPHTASQYEVGAASDTTLVRSAAGLVTVEGNELSFNLDPVVDDADNFASNFTGVNLRGGTFIANASGTSALPAAASHLKFAYSVDDSVSATVNRNGSDTFTLSYLVDGTPTQTASLTSLSLTGPELCTFQYRSAGVWEVQCGDNTTGS